MAINQEIYGSSDTWIEWMACDTNSAYISEGSTFKTAYFGGPTTTREQKAYASTFSVGAANGTLTLNHEIDKSTCFLGTDGGFWGADIAYISGGNPTQTGVNGANAKKVFYNKTESNNPIMFTAMKYTNVYVTGSSTSSVNLKLSSSPDDSVPWGIDLQTSKYNYRTAAINGEELTYCTVAGGNLMPITEMDIKNVVWVPLVRCFNVTDGTDWDTLNGGSNPPSTISTPVRTFDLASYMKGTIVYNGETKPIYEVFKHITGVCVIPMIKIRDGTTSNIVRSVPTVNLSNIPSNTGEPYYTPGLSFTILGSRHVEVTQVKDTDTSETIVTDMYDIQSSRYFQTTSSNYWLYSSDYDAGQLASFSLSSVGGLTGILGAWGFNSSHYTWSVQNSYYYNLNMFLGASKMTIHPLNPNQNYVCIEMEYYDGFESEVMQQVARLGGFFSPSYQAARQEELDSDLIYCGTIPSNGITTGEYTQGTANRQQPQFSDDFDPWKDTGYNPGGDEDSDIDENDYIDSMGGHSDIALAQFSKLYAIDAINLNNARLYLNSVPVKSQDFETLEEYQHELYGKYLNGNPIDCILSCKWYPFNTSTYVMRYAAQTEIIKISNTQMSFEQSSVIITASGTTSLTPTTIFTMQLGHFSLKKYPKNFAAYEPYTHAQLYLPFCTAIEMDLKIITDHSVYIQYKVDVKTGSFTAIISLDAYDGAVINTASGILSVDIPISGIQTGDYQNAVYQAINNLKSAQIQGNINAVSKAGAIAQTALTQNLAGTATTALTAHYTFEQDKINKKSAQYTLNATQIPYATVGASSAGDGAIMYLYPVLEIQRPIPLQGNSLTRFPTYAHTVGYACLKYDKLSNFTGLTVCESIDLTGIPATEKEKSMIASLSKNGIYL